MPSAAGTPAAFAAPSPGWRALAPITLVALAARAAAIGNPVIASDEQFYLALAHGWARGGLPYVDIWDRKPIGLFLLYLPAGALRNPWAGVVAYQLFALVAAIGTAWLIARLAAAAGWRAGAVPAAALYLLWLDLADGQGGQSPVFYNLPMAAAALLVMTARGRRAGVAAMALVGVALQIKYAAVFEGAWFGVSLLWRDRAAAWPGRAAYALALAAAAALPSAIAALAFVAVGAGQAWWFANIVSVLRRAQSPWPELLGNAAICVAILAIPVGLAIAGLRRGAGEGAAFLRGWLIAALTGLVAFGTWFDHYTLPVLVPASVAAAAVLRVGWRRWALLAAAALVGQAAIARARAERGTPAQFAALAAGVGSGPGCLYVYAGPSALYPFTDRCRASRFLYPSHLTRTREAPAIGVAPLVEIDRLFDARPAVVVAGRPFRGEDPAARALLGNRLARGYRLAATYPLGRDRLGVYVRR